MAKLTAAQRTEYERQLVAAHARQTALPGEVVASAATLQNAETALVNAETDLQNKETALVNAETDLQNKETALSAAKDAVIAAFGNATTLPPAQADHTAKETARNDAKTARNDAKTARDTAKVVRNDAKTARDTAKTAHVHKEEELAQNPLKIAGLEHLLNPSNEYGWAAVGAAACAALFLLMFLVSALITTKNVKDANAQTETKKDETKPASTTNSVTGNIDVKQDADGRTVVTIASTAGTLPFHKEGRDTFTSLPVGKPNALKDMSKVATTEDEQRALGQIDDTKQANNNTEAWRNVAITPENAGEVGEVLRRHVRFMKDELDPLIKKEHDRMESLRYPGPGVVNQGPFIPVK